MRGDVQVKLVIGEQSLLLHYVSVSRSRIPLFAGISLAGCAFALVFSLMLHGAFGALIALDTDRVDELSIDLLISEDAFAEMLVAPEPEVEPVAFEAIANAHNAVDATHESTTSSKENGGSPDAAPTRTPGGGGGDAMSRRVANNSGLLRGTTTMNTLLASRGPAAFDQVNDWEGYDPSAPMSDVPGTYGLGPHGTGRVTSGNPGPGQYGGPGLPGPGEPGKLAGPATRARLSEKANNAPPRGTVRPKAADISGSLTKRQIRKVVTQHKRQLAACYQRELMQKRSLHGKVLVKWIIDGSGNIVSVLVMSSTMNNDAVESCLTRSIEGWRFPTPKSGGLVSVTYPFVFEVR